jgi:dUTP pyrophosphatase
MRIKNTSENKVFYATADSAGFDISSNEDGVLGPGEFRVFKTGLFLDREGAIGKLGGVVWEMQIRPRSGLAAKFGVTVLNAPGTIDMDFEQEIGVILINHGKQPFVVKKGDRIAQGVAALAYSVSGVEQKGDTRTGGFGSTSNK